ncbi:MAG: RagB/SusD family nutrient uptake outer membrane protein [Prolixibacteraceae bacterium]
MKINKIIYILLAFFVLNACTEDDLTVLPDGNELVETFYQTDEQIILALNGAYDPFQHVIWGGSTFLWGSITSDDAVGGGGDENDQKGYQVCDRFLASPVEDKDVNLQDFYTLWWKMNTRANAIIAYADINSKLGSKAVANAYFLKGMAYFQLTRMFGRMPIIDDIPGITSVYPRAESVDVTWDAAEGYLKEAIKLTTGGMGLDVQVDKSTGYATLGSAQILLGKIYLYRGKNADAIAVLEDLVNDGYYALEPNFADVFDPARVHGVESLFEINMTSKGAASWDGAGNNGNAIATLVSPRCFSNNTQPLPDGIHMSGWGMNQPTQKLAAAFDDMNDVIRKEATMLDTATIQFMCDTAGVTTIWENVLTGFYDNKHSARQGYFVSATQVNQNLIVLRYSDALLMLAEAHHLNGNDGKAQSYLNQVRTRVSLPDVTATGADLFTAIKRERQLELALEGDRYFDLVRWGDAEKELTGEDYDNNGESYATGLPGKASNGYFPIPQAEINAYGDNDYGQNEGY